jgi:NAD(P)-dependent dehydrogenase (short-subunit alcohol dehydrogenase family)
MKKPVAGKIILITGSTDGLGKLVARNLLEKNATILLHGRNKEKGKMVLEQLKELTGNEKIEYYNADLSSLKEVKQFSETIIKEQEHLDVLINNAGIGRGIDNKRELSKDGIELRFAVNYLSHVLLTEKLLPIVTPKTGRIINVSSVGQEPVNFDDLMLEKHYDGYYAYKQSKAAQIMYTLDLAERLKDQGIKVNAVHPSSLMNTKMVLDEWGYSLSTVEQGASAVENLIHVDTTGAYYDKILLSKAIPQVYNLKARQTLTLITNDLLKNYL